MLEPQSWVAIGVARTPFARGQRIPAQGAPGEIEIFAEFSGGLRGIDAASHLHVLAWLDASPRDLLEVRPKKMGLNAPLQGVFSVRTPVRPNPLALTTTRLLARNERVLHLARLDLYDGTPILDLKPYSPGWDQVLWARDPRQSWVGDLEEASREAMWRREAEDAVEFPDHPRITEVISALRRAVAGGFAPRDPRLRYTVPALDLAVDALAVMASATFGNARLRYDPSAAQVEVDLPAAPR